MRAKKIISFAAAASLMFLLLAAPALASNTNTNKLSYEFDNGDFGLLTHSWFYELQKNTAALNVTTHDYGYADAGVVADLGLADNLPSTGITADTTGSMAENIWIGNGSGANTPGQYSSSNFCYGFETANGSGSFDMQSNCGVPPGTVMTAAQIESVFSGDEVYAWVGTVYTGTTVSGSVSAVNGQAIGNRTMSITQNGDGTVTAVVH